MEIDKILKSKIDSIKKAIESGSVIIFRYTDDERRVVEPVAIGVQKDSGKYVMIGYRNHPLEVSDNIENWKQYEIEQIQGLQLTPFKAKTFRSGYEIIYKEMTEMLFVAPAYKMASA